MGKRSISSVVFVVVVVSFFLLREYVNTSIFEILLCFFLSMATFELARALKPFATKGVFLVAVIFGILYVPHFYVINSILKLEYVWAFQLLWSILGVIFALIMCLIHKEKGKFIASSLPFLYPVLLVLTTILMENLGEPKGFLALLLLFVISPSSDSLAYLVGMTYSKIKKGNAKKLCPKLSPKKTVAGAIGGIVGGILGSLLVCLIFRNKVELSNISYPYLIFAIVGLFGSVLTEVGDLFESFIKRKVGIKDMGKIMPGHGGIMDRIDGMSFASVFIYFTFLLI